MIWELVLSCQIQDDLSLYYNMVAVNDKMDPKISAKHKDSKAATGEGLITQSL